MHYATFNIPFCLFVISVLFASCDKEEKAKIPVVTSIQLDATELTLNAGDEPIVSKIIFRSKNIVRPISQLVEKQMNYS